MRALVTGADGFVGQWLVRRLLTDGVPVSGVIRSAEPALVTLDAASARAVAWHRCDLTDATAVREVVHKTRPEAVFHLAAQSSVPDSLSDPLRTFSINVMGLAHLLEAIRRHAPDCLVLAVGSADAYGAVRPDDLPLREDDPLRPVSPYAASKAAAESIALQYARAGMARVVAVRPFNHTGPGQSTAFAIASFAQQTAAIKRASRGGTLSSGASPATLRVGDLSPRRDICDVRDVVDAYVRLAHKGIVGRVYNVCRGADTSMREVVDLLLRLAGIEARIEVEPDRLRPVETPVLRGDPSLIMQDAGWRAATPLERTLVDMLEFYGA